MRRMAWQDGANGQRCLEFDITYNCDMGCKQCNRACVVCPSTDVMTCDQVRRVLDESLSLASPYREIWVLGGEPSLHPRLSTIIEALNSYRKQVDGCVVRLWTHGWGDRVRRVLEQLPAWVGITVSAKEPGIAPHGFNAFLLAPIDYRDICSDDYENGCSWIAPGKCGVGISRHGIYVCAVAAAIDRVVGLNIGLKSLADVSNMSFRNQCKQLCGYCGHFLADRGVRLTGVAVSTTWHQLVAKYHGERPRLTLY